MDIARIRKKVKKQEKNTKKSKKTEKNKVKDRETSEIVTKSDSEGIEEMSQLDDRTESTEETRREPKEEASDKELSDDIYVVPEEDQTEKILTFKLSEEEYAFYMKDIQEITNYYSITPIPRCPAYLAGVISLRGKIIPLLNLKRLFNITEQADSKDNSTKRNKAKKVIILKAPRGPIGVIADMILETQNVKKGFLKDSPGNISESEARYIDSIAVIKNRFISILNVDSIVSLNFLASETPRQRSAIH